MTVATVLRKLFGVMPAYGVPARAARQVVR